jgi:hypothetical protein
MDLQPKLRVFPWLFFFGIILSFSLIILPGNCGTLRNSYKEMHDFTHSEALTASSEYVTLGLGLKVFWRKGAEHNEQINHKGTQRNTKVFA